MNQHITGSFHLAAAWQLFALLLLAFPTLALANTYYVATTGADTNLGTDIAPWRTLQKAADSVGAGDTVIVRAGTYVGFVLGWNFPQNGTAAAPITFQADPGVIIDTRNYKTADGINLEGCSYIVIDGFTVNNASGTITRAGIRSVSTDTPYNNHVTIRHNTCDNNGTWGIFTSHVDDLLIEHNTCSRSHTQHGIYVSNACVRPVVHGNTLWGNYACGLHMNGDLSMGGTGLIAGALVEDNVIYDNGLGGGSGINCDGVQDSVIRNNLLYNAHGAGISLYQIDAAAPSVNNVVVNNTVDVAANGKWALQIHNGSSGCTVFNNIFLSHHSYRASIHLSSSGDLVGLACDYNILYGAQPVTPDDDATRLTLAQWQAMGYDTHSVTATQGAVFMDWTTGDYHLASNGPAVDTGVTALNGKAAPVDDRDGKLRPIGSGYDLGCYEAGAQPVLTSIVVSPVKAIAAPGKTATFTAVARDQFNNPLAVQPTFTWSVSGGGAIAQTGVFTAGSTPGGPFTVTASAGGKLGKAKVYVSTNRALLGTGYSWSSLGASVSTANRRSTPGVNDNILAADLPLHAGADLPNTWEAAGVIWASPQTITKVRFFNGSYDTQGNGVFCAGFTLQYTLNGLAWQNLTGWSLTPAYAFNSAAAGGMMYTFTGPAKQVLGMRCVGKVYTPGQALSSRFVRVREVQAF